MGVGVHAVSGEGTQGYPQTPQPCGSKTFWAPSHQNWIHVPLQEGPVQIASPHYSPLNRNCVIDWYIYRSLSLQLLVNLLVHLSLEAWHRVLAQ